MSRLTEPIPDSSRSSTDLVDPRWIRVPHPSSFRLVAGIAGFVLVVAYGLFVAVNPTVTAADQRLLIALNAQHSPALDLVTRTISIGFSPPYAFSIIVLLVIVLTLVGRRLGDALFTGGSIGVVYACTYLVKMIVRRPRPALLPHSVSGLAPETDPSYPSGHVAIVTALVVVLFLVARHAWQRWVIAVAGALLILATAFARLYVGVHYLDDITASVVYVISVGPLIYLGLYRLDSRWRVSSRVDWWYMRLTKQ